MYRYTYAPAPTPHPQRPRHSTYLDPLPYPHHLTARSYDTTYMLRPYHTEPQQRQSSHYKAPYSTQATCYRPVQTPSWRHVRPVQTQQPQTKQQSERERETSLPPRKSSLKKTAERRVHFDLPPAALHQSASRTARIAAEEREQEKERVRQKGRERERECDRDRDRIWQRDQERERDRQRERDTYKEPPYRPPVRPTPPPHFSSSRRYDEEMYKQDYRNDYTTTSSYNTYEYDAHRSHHYTATTSSQPLYPSLSTRPPFLNQSPLPTYPTVYIITYGTSVLPSPSSEISISTLLASQVPARTPPIPHLYTIDARTMQPPNPSLCATYSGISPLIQDVVMQDPAARKAAREAVETLLAFGERRGRGRRGEGGGMEAIGVLLELKRAREERDGALL
ncbi:conserved hypothetical protein [Pyrenophora tritici-repentis Pt-1C-BFP]|uniref:Uncharacterized protein n=1 Tax=Pyrenophora tritici-repentis (strain Pt-1C-BFP) TaxID=426418 RepID=B2WNV5_PYRTR|nr:uncharacterized protein PTRG_11665 [Pyrenophora tritici-repentis Pt-1C-BFP]EDU44715.1 conserved hypothetical protein [Pyrenophora tritici-repentis Pt-1C-BFP]